MFLQPQRLKGLMVNDPVRLSWWNNTFLQREKCGKNGQSGIDKACKMFYAFLHNGILLSSCDSVQCSAIWYWWYQWCEMREGGIGDKHDCGKRCRRCFVTEWIYSCLRVFWRGSRKQRKELRVNHVRKIGEGENEYYMILRWWSDQYVLLTIVLVHCQGTGTWKDAKSKRTEHKQDVTFPNYHHSSLISKMFAFTHICSFF